MSGPRRVAGGLAPCLCGGKHRPCLRHQRAERRHQYPCPPGPPPDRREQRVIRGSELWTTMAHRAAVIITLARTDEPNPPERCARGLSLLIVPTGQPGLTISRAHLAGMRAARTCRCLFDDTTAPATTLLGQRGRGFHAPWGPSTSSWRSRALSALGWHALPAKMPSPHQDPPRLRAADRRLPGDPAPAGRDRCRTRSRTPPRPPGRRCPRPR